LVSSFWFLPFGFFLLVSSSWFLPFNFVLLVPSFCFLPFGCGVVRVVLFAEVGDKEPLENQATRGKMERLRLLMKERRERRRAMREARQSPYASPPQRWSAKSETQPTNGGDAMDTEQPLCELTPPEPVVA